MRIAGIYALFLLLGACGAKEPPPPPEAPRPVKVLELAETNPVEPLLLTGSVESWKEQEVGFEVEGVLRYVVEPGTYLEGRWTEGDEVRVEGDVLARMDTQAYEIAKATVAANVEVAKETLDTARVHLTKVLPASLKAAEAGYIRANEEYVREVKLFEDKVVSQVDVIRKRADRDRREALVEGAKAQIDAQEAQIKSLEAELQRAKEYLRQAQYDLDRCVLYAPFSGEVSEVFVEAGGYARRGQQIARIVMMTPIKVDLAVSPERAARLRRGDAVRLHVEGREPLLATVYEKATTADPQTRTFRVSVITRNERDAPFGPDDPRASMPMIQQMMPILRSPEGRLFVEERRSLRKDDKGYFVWADPAVSFGSAPDGTVVHLRKFHVKLGEERRSLQGLYLTREVLDAGGLEDGTHVPLDMPETDAEEVKIVIARPQWLLRPGQLVRVLLAPQAPQPGFYVPINAIVPVSETKGVIFLEADGKARRVEVRLLGRVRGMFHVEGEGVAAGSRVIMDYIHFLQEGERVRVTRIRKSGS